MDKPRLFGLNNCNRDFSQKNAWGKNQFNNSFPTSLACYMSLKKIKPVYLKVNHQLKVEHSLIDVSDIFGINVDSPDLFFAFERDYLPYQSLVLGTLPRVDLVTVSQSLNLCLRCLEIKLTALPDNTTCELSQDNYGCEIVVRPPTIVYIAVSIAKAYQLDRNSLVNNLQPVCSQIKDWTEADDILPLMEDITNATDTVLSCCVDSQVPMIMQPVWKTVGKSAKLDNDSLDIFVWSNIAFTRLFVDAAKTEIKLNKISRHKRCVLWLAKMLYDFACKGKIDHESTIDQMSFNTKNDKAFALSGYRTHQYMKCDELTKPRIKREEIKNIILGGGEKLLSPERRFDAIIFNTPDIFE